MARFRFLTTTNFRTFFWELSPSNLSEIGRRLSTGAVSYRPDRWYKYLKRRSVSAKLHCARTEKTVVLSLNFFWPVSVSCKSGEETFWRLEGQRPAVFYGSRISGHGFVLRCLAVRGNLHNTVKYHLLSALYRLNIRLAINPYGWY